jgi:MFS family permease
MLIHPVVMMFVAKFSGSASDRWGHKPLTVAGLTVAALTSVLLSFLDISAPAQLAFAGLFGVGLGAGLYTSPSNNAMMNSVPPDQTGVASGMVATSRTIGQTFGVSLGSIVISGRSQFYARTAPDPAVVYTLAQRDAYWICAVIVALMAFATIWAYRPKTRKKHT